MANSLWSEENSPQLYLFFFAHLWQLNFLVKLVTLSLWWRITDTICKQKIVVLLNVAFSANVGELAFWTTPAQVCLIINIQGFHDKGEFTYIYYRSLQFVNWFSILSLNAIKFNYGKTRMYRFLQVRISTELISMNGSLNSVHCPHRMGWKSSKFWTRSEDRE